MFAEKWGNEEVGGVYFAEMWTDLRQQGEGGEVCGTKKDPLFHVSLRLK